MPESVAVPLEVIRRIVGAAERAIAALPAGAPEADDLETVVGLLAAEVLRAMGFDEGEL